MIWPPTSQEVTEAEVSSQPPSKVYPVDSCTNDPLVFQIFITSLTTTAFDPKKRRQSGAFTLTQTSDTQPMQIDVPNSQYILLDGPEEATLEQPRSMQRVSYVEIVEGWVALAQFALLKPWFDDISQPFCFW